MFPILFPRFMKRRRLRSISRSAYVQRLAIGVVAVLVWMPPVQGQDALDVSKLVGQVQNPVINTANPDLIAYERLLRDAQELYLYHRRTGAITRVRGGVEEDAMPEVDVSFLNLFADRDLDRLSSYDGQLAWRPRLDALERQWFAFVSGGSGGGIDLHLSYVDADGRLATEAPLRLSFSGTECFPQWSPDGTSLLFVSGTEGVSDLFWIPDVASVIARRGEAFEPEPLTATAGPELFPAWSPDGQFVAYQTLTFQEGRQNWGISLIAVPNRDSSDLPQAIPLTDELNAFNEFKPSWSPDGQQIAYYVSQEEAGEESSHLLQDIGVLTLIRGSGSDELSGQVLSGFSRRLAQNVLPHMGRGPAWMPISDELQIVYVHRDPQTGFPLFAADLALWQARQSDFAKNFSEQFGTQNHRNPVLALMPDGLRIVFVSQEGNANKLQVFDQQRRVPRQPVVEVELSKSTAVRKSLIVPGMGQFYKGQRAKGAFFIAAEAVAIGAAVFFAAKNSSHASDADAAMRAYEDALKTITDPNASTSAEAHQHLEDWQTAYDDAERAQRATVVAVAAVAGVWAFNVLDSSLGFPRVVRRPVHIASMEARPRLLLAQQDGNLRYGVSVHLKFARP